MATIDTILRLCQEQGITLFALEKELGFGHNSLRKGSRIRQDRLEKIADYFGVTVDYLINGEATPGYYYDEETAKLAQAYYENRDLRMLFDAARDAKPEDIRLSYDMLMALKRKEKHED